MNYNPYHQTGARGAHRGQGRRGPAPGSQGYPARSNEGGQPVLISLLVSGVATVARHLQGMGDAVVGGSGETGGQAIPRQPVMQRQAQGRQEPGPQAGPSNGVSIAVAVASAVFLTFALRFFLWWVLVYTCIVEPLFSTLRAMEDTTRDRERRWLTYWSFFAVGVGVDFALGSTVLTSLRGSVTYPAVLFFALTWLRRNEAANAALIYEGYVRPAALRNAHLIDEIHNEFMRATSSVARTIVDSTNAALEPYAQRDVDEVPNEPEQITRPTRPTRATRSTRAQRGDPDIPAVYVQELD